MLGLPLMAQAADPLPRAKPEDVGMSSERLALIAKTVNAEIAREQLPGAVLAIARRGKLVYFETFGFRDKAAGAPMPADAIFNIASMTKPMAAVAGLQLYAQGKLLMDETGSKYFPKFANMQVAVRTRSGKTSSSGVGHPQDHHPGLVPSHVRPDLRRAGRDSRAQTVSRAAVRPSDR
jgi:CubicO group peptidase (beta-lactamase class C family)